MLRLEDGAGQEVVPVARGGRGVGGGEGGRAAGRKEEAGVVDLKEEPVCVWRRGRRHRGWSCGRFQNMLL